MYFMYLYFFETVSLCNPVWLGTCYVDQTGLEIIEIHLPLSPKCWD